MNKTIYFCILSAVLLLLITEGCVTRARRSDLGVLKKEARTDLGQYKSDE